MITLYQQIVNLRESKKRQERGYQFEQLIREIQPWEFKPPVVIAPKSEQIDGVYTRNGITYIIESKAKAKKITQGDHDWEDFEVKIRRRHGNGIIGIFCSLYTVHKNVYEAGDRLNNEGIYNFIIAGDTWDQLLHSQLDFGNLVDYMVQYVRTNNSSKPPKIQHIFEWIYDKNDVCKKLISLCQKESGLFLRRYRHKHHEQLYVKRTIDNSIYQIINQLKPTSLKNKQPGQNEFPKQFIVIRDLSGSGKTTTAVELSLSKKDYAIIGFTANQVSIDDKIDGFFNKCKHNYINELKSINSPIVFVIDSLDEVTNVREKKREIKSIFEKVEELNSFALSLQYLCFPILIIYTVRDDYYRDWESDFEGRNQVAEKRKSITYFMDDEFVTALKNYNEVYKYTITNIKTLSKESKEILSIPINLEIFSDANEFEGEIFVTEIWEGKILQSYFDRKTDDITKHLPLGVSKELCLNILSRLAFFLVELKRINFNKNEFRKVISEEFSILHANCETFFQLLQSEQILMRDVEKRNDFGFRYQRFIEYLVAYYSVTFINRTNDVNWLDKFTQMIFDSGFLSMFKVFDNIKHISESLYPDIKVDIENHFQKSEQFMSKKLPFIRSNIANGIKTSKEDLKMIFDNTFSNNPQLTFNAFFVIAAKLNNLPSKTIIDTFKLSWSTNSKNPNRWKLLNGIAKHGLLFNEHIIKTIINTNDSKTWEVYLGFVCENNLVCTFNELEITQLFENKIHEFLSASNEEWNYNNQLLNGIKSNKNFLPGNVIVECDPLTYFTNTNSTIPNDIDKEKKLELIRTIDEIENVFFKKTKRGLYIPPISSLWENELNFFNNEFNKRFNKPFGKDKKPLLNHLIANNDQISTLIQFIVENPIDCNILGIDVNKVTLFQEIFNSTFHNKSLLFEYLVHRKYPKRKLDEDFLNNELKRNPHNHWCYLGWFYYSVSDLKIVKKISTNERTICALLSFKYNRVIGFKFTNIIQVANNALSHYNQHYHLIIKAIKIYNLYESLSTKSSFLKKEMDLQSRPIVLDRNSDDMFKEFFPELFTKQE